MLGRETTQGKGGHGSLVRSHQGVTRRQTTWPALRKARPVPIAFLWECLERLGIGYREFAASCVKKPTEVPCDASD